nr:hypothetical protein [Tanacetum cinerariifolium]
MVAAVVTCVRFLVEKKQQTLKNPRRICSRLCDKNWFQRVLVNWVSSGNQQDDESIRVLKNVDTSGLCCLVSKFEGLHSLDSCSMNVNRKVESLCSFYTAGITETTGLLILCDKIRNGI